MESQTGPVTLKVVANRDIKAGELCYAEEPSVRGHLQMLADRVVAKNSIKNKDSNVLIVHGALTCENCKCQISDMDVNRARKAFGEAYKQDLANGNSNQIDALEHECACAFADPLVVFCRPRPALAAVQEDDGGDGGDGGSGKIQATATGPLPAPLIPR